MYTQEYDDFVHRGMGVLDDYARLFGLNDTAVGVLHQYMRWWSILRQCCGPQQSKDHMLQLHNATVELSHQPTDYDYPACQTYNLQEAENELLDSELAKIAVRCDGTGVPQAVLQASNVRLFRLASPCLTSPPTLSSPFLTRRCLASLSRTACVRQRDALMATGAVVGGRRSPAA